jgi:hypothetical protein
MNSTDCTNLALCYGTCPSSSTSCYSNCNTTYPGGVVPANNLGLCLTSSCPGLCDSGDTTGNNGGEAGSGGSTAGVAKIKFCHALTSSSQSVTYTINVNGTKVSATSGNCAPVNSCLAVPAGKGSPVTLTSGTATLSTGTIDITPGMELLIRAELDSNSNPIWRSGTASGICSGGTGTSGTEAKFCNFLQKGSADFLLTLKLGGATFSAMSGTCSPIGSCTTIPSGTDVSITLLDGTTTVVSGTFPTVGAGANMVFRADMDPTTSKATVFGATYATGLCSTATGAHELSAPNLSPFSPQPLQETQLSAIQANEPPPPALYRSLSTH